HVGQEPRRASVSIRLSLGSRFDGNDDLRPGLGGDGRGGQQRHDGYQQFHAMLLRHNTGMKSAILALAVLVAGQNARPVTVVSEVRAALNAHDLARAEAIVAERRAALGNTPDVIEGVSWLGRGALAEKQADRAERYAVEAQ